MLLVWGTPLEKVWFQSLSRSAEPCSGMGRPNFAPASMENISARISSKAQLLSVWAFTGCRASRDVWPVALKNSRSFAA